jgi:hypothetical protein
MPHQCTGCGHTFADGSKEMLSGCPECGGNKFQFRPSEEDLPDDPADEGPTEADAPSRPDTESSSVAETVGRATTKMRDLVSSGPDTPPEDTADTSTESPIDSGTEVGSNPVAEAASTTDESEPRSADPELDAQSSPDAEPNPEAAWPSESEDDTEAAGPETEPLDDDSEIIDADARRSAMENSEEDLAQASARSDVVPEEELPEADDATPGSGADASGLESAEATVTDPEPDVDGRVVSEPDDEQPDIAELREQLNDQFESIKIVEPGQYELNLMELYDREEYIIALQENGRYVIQVPEQWMGEDPDER